MVEEEDKITLKGGCHCKAVRYEFKTVKNIDIYQCNCSICNMKRNHHFVIPKSEFKLLSGEEDLSVYRFGTEVAQHKFCTKCGVQSFYNPRSNPDGVGVTIYCVDDWDSPGFAGTITWKTFDGKNWEEQIKTSDIVGKDK